MNHLKSSFNAVFKLPAFLLRRSHVTFTVTVFEDEAAPAQQLHFRVTKVFYGGLFASSEKCYANSALARQFLDRLSAHVVETIIPRWISILWRRGNSLERPGRVDFA